MPIVPKPADIARFSGLPVDLLGRVSGKIQESDGYSLPNQLREGREAAAMLGVRIVTEDFEQGSGTDWELAGINAHIARVKRGEVKALIIKNVSRLARGSGKQAWIEHEIEEAGGLIWYYDESYEDSAIGRLQRRIAVDVAQYMLEQAREDSMKARHEKVAVFKRPVGNGPLPYGWRRVIDASGAKPRTVGYEHDPEHVKVIHRFRAVRTVSTQALCDQLQADGVPTPALYRPSEKRPLSGRWEPYTIRHILANPMIWGEYRYGRLERYKVNGKWRQREKAGADVQTLQLDPILERAEVEELRGIISRRHRRHATGWSETTADDLFVLRGMLTCGICGSSLRSLAVSGRTRSGGTDRYYRCPLTNARIAARQGRERCTLPPVAADGMRRGASGAGIEDLVWPVVAAFFGSEQTMIDAIQQMRKADDSAARHAARLAFVRGDLSEKRAAFQRATDRWADAEDALDRDSFEGTRQRLKREIASEERELRELEQFVPRGIGETETAALLALGREVRAALGNETPSERQVLCARLRLGVTVTPVLSGGYAVGRHWYEVEGTALGRDLRSSTRDNLTWLSLKLRRSGTGGLSLSLRAA